MIFNLRKCAIILACALIPAVAYPQSPIKAEMLWSISGTPVGTERELHPVIALTDQSLFVGGSIQKGDERRRQVIQVFDSATGRYQRTIEDVTGEVFAGHGEQIVANTQFLVTATYRPSGADAGALQVYDTQTGAHLRTIPNPRAKDSSYFGQLQVSLMGSKILAGVGLSTDNQSTSWVFDAGTGEILLTIDEPDNEGGFLSKAPRTLFGGTNAMTETHILIGARNKAADGMRNVGAAYLFDAKSGELLRTFTPEDPQSDMLFSIDMALTQDKALISGFRNVGPLGWPSAEISAYDLSTGEKLYTLQDPFVPMSNEDFAAGKAGSAFGQDFEVWNDLLIVGLPELNAAKEKVGGLFFFDVATGKRVLGLVNQNGAEGEELGYAMARHGDQISVVLKPELAAFQEIIRVDTFRLGRN